jgi:hypothetical protein
VARQVLFATRMAALKRIHEFMKAQMRVRRAKNRLRDLQKAKERRQRRQEDEAKAALAVYCQTM